MNDERKFFLVGRGVSGGKRDGVVLGRRSLIGMGETEMSEYWNGDGLSERLGSDLVFFSATFREFRVHFRRTWAMDLLLAQLPTAFRALTRPDLQRIPQTSSPENPMLLDAAALSSTKAKREYQVQACVKNLRTDGRYHHHYTFERVENNPCLKQAEWFLVVGMIRKLGRRVLSIHRYENSLGVEKYGSASGAMGREGVDEELTQKSSWKQASKKAGVTW
ncbi:uncharacterized protein MYCFIDRAFT_179363 [Pseudocercospora fijiensis CIRAD86]|uniref:Uncharacterized protein n=1 Tax=Pseudocercospora fijiensis (strain CIRAD86) TaxID=383855 RepID=M3A0G5_PSEFD|nr:uncharacterized protein MYCFIDRAFT_179363 [Pseudocercospora fijiensis CIRAD86]EME77896.1 hypothetical protein MYCFIDRAFT_179363 [Pseudocercospora fijiensis CIRAD86]